MKEKRKDYLAEKILNLLKPHFGENLEALQKTINQISKGKLIHENQRFLQGVLKLFFEDDINIFTGNNIQNLVSQYHEFIKQVSLNEPDLYQQEKTFTQYNIFYKLAYPMDIVKYLFPLYNNSTGFHLNTLIAKVGLELLDLISKSNARNVPEPEMLLFLSNFLSNFKKRLVSRELDKEMDHLKNYLSTQHMFPRDSLNKMNEMLDQLITLYQAQRKILQEIKKNPTELGRDFLRAINYTQSHMEYFCRYIHRLFHLLKKHNMKYGDFYYKHYYWEFKKNNFIEACEQELSKYPDLKNYLKNIVTQLKELRNINAHQIPREFYIVPENNLMCFPVVGSNEYKCIEHENVADKIINYGFFINNIGLHPNNPYERSENLFLSLI